MRIFEGKTYMPACAITIIQVSASSWAEATRVCFRTVARSYRTHKYIHQRKKKPDHDEGPAQNRRERKRSNYKKRLQETALTASYDGCKKPHIRDWMKSYGFMYT